MLTSPRARHLSAAARGGRAQRQAHVRPGERWGRSRSPCAGPTSPRSSACAGQHAAEPRLAAARTRPARDRDHLHHRPGMGPPRGGSAWGPGRRLTRTRPLSRSVDWRSADCCFNASVPGGWAGAGDMLTEGLRPGAPLQDINFLPISRPWGHLASATLSRRVLERCRQVS
jgi:hypothetical protein